MRRRHHRRCQGRLTRLASLARSLTAPAAAGLLLALATLLVITPAQGNWQPSLTVDLFPYDAGTEEGTEFSLSNAATSPQGAITSIKGRGKFSNEPIATLTFTLQEAAPEITSATTFTVDEGTTAVETLTAKDQDTAAADLEWSKAGGADADQFMLSTDGDLAFAAAPDYENPGDADGDRTYEITVQVSDGDHTDTADIRVTLQNVIELLTELEGPSSTDYAENGAVRVAAYTASSEADRDGIAWQPRRRRCRALQHRQPSGRPSLPHRPGRRQLLPQAAGLRGAGRR